MQAEDEACPPATCPDCRGEVEVTWETRFASCSCGCVWEVSLYDLFSAGVQDLFERMGVAP